MWASENLLLTPIGSSNFRQPQTLTQQIHRFNLVWLFSHTLAIIEP